MKVKIILSETKMEELVILVLQLKFFLFQVERNIHSVKVDTIPADESFPTPQLKK